MLACGRSGRPARLAAVICLICLIGVAGTACTGSGDRSPASSGPRTATPVRPILQCAAAVRVPAVRTEIVPSAKLAPTAVLQVGGALTFALPAGAAVGFSGPANASEQATVCQAPDAGSAVLVALAPGYVRVARNVDGRQDLVLVKITP